MKFLSRVVWSEGMHLGPHHFQTQSRYFEDTLWFLSSDLPDCDSVPEPAQLSGLFASTDSEIILHLAIPPRLDQGLDCDLAGGASARYGAVQRTVRDDSVGQGENSVSFARKNLVLLSQAQLSSDTVSFPIARIFRSEEHTSELQSL